MKVLLASCSFEDGAREKEIQFNSHYPLGLGSIHSYLESKGHEVTTLFLNDYPQDYCLGEIRKIYREYDVLGLNVLSHNRVCSYRAIEEFGDQIQIVIGGIHASVMYEQIIEKYKGVIAVIGEGEETFAELLEGGPPADVKGIAYWGYEMVERTPDRELLDLNLLPYPKHEVFWNEQRVTAGIITSRGCPHKCSFCCLDVVSRGKIRFRSVDSVIGEIKHLKDMYPALRFIWIHDDSFLADNQRAIEICKRIALLKLEVMFICSARLKPLSEKMVEALEKAYFLEVLFGLESGCQRVLDANDKGITQYDAIRAFRLFKNSKIRVTAFLTVGLPGEDDESVMETWQFVNHLQRIRYTRYEDIGILMVYPGTKVYELSKKAGTLTDDYWMTDGPVPFYTAEHDVVTLTGYKEEILDHIAASRMTAPA